MHKYHICISLLCFHFEDSSLGGIFTICLTVITQGIFDSKNVKFLVPISILRFLSIGLLITLTIHVFIFWQKPFGDFVEDKFLIRIQLESHTGGLPYSFNYFGVTLSDNFESWFRICDTQHWVDIRIWSFPKLDQVFNQIRIWSQIYWLKCVPERISFEF